MPSAASSRPLKALVILFYVKLAMLYNLYINIGRSVRTVSEGRTAGMPTNCIDNHVTLPSDG